MKVRCPDCGSKGVLNAELAGQRVRCARCRGEFVAREENWPDEGVKWYYAAGEEKKGPLREDEFERLIAAGTILPATLVWRKGMSGWQTLAEVRAEDPFSVAPAEEPRAQAANAGPLGAEQARELRGTPLAATRPAVLPYAGGGKRLIAKVIDLVFMGAMASLVEALSRKLFPDAFGAETINSVYIITMLVAMLLGMFYVVWFVGKFGATPGKMVVSIKVVTPSGGRVDYLHAFGRYWSEFVVIWLTLMLGYLPILFDSQRRGLHDRLCSTRVVKA